jgi:hypothetical protein
VHVAELGGFLDKDTDTQTNGKRIGHRGHGWHGHRHGHGNGHRHEHRHEYRHGQFLSAPVSWCYSVSTL